MVSPINISKDDLITVENNEIIKIERDGKIIFENDVLEAHPKEWGFVFSGKDYAKAHKSINQNYIPLITKAYISSLLHLLDGVIEISVDAAGKRDNETMSTFIRYEVKFNDTKK
jgi:hypothetical protein